MLFPLVDENPTRRFPFVTIGLLVANTVVLLSMWPLDAAAHNRIFYRFGFVPQRLTATLAGESEVEVDLAKLLADSPEAREILDTLPEDTTIDVSAGWGVTGLSLLTSLFLHAGVAHLVGNMWFLWIFGNNIEDRLGHLPFVLFYLCGGLAATLCHWVATTGEGVRMPTVGASGAVAAVLGAYAVTYPSAKVRCLLFVFVLVLFVDLPAIAVLGVWMFGQIVEGLAALHLGINGGVAWWAHIGGFAFGAVAMIGLLKLIPDSTYRSVLRRERDFEYEPSSFNPQDYQR